MLKWTFGIVFFLCTCSSFLAQKPEHGFERSGPDSLIDKDGKAIESIRVNLSFGSVLIPSTLKEYERKCYEGGCWKFADGDMVLTIIWDNSARPPNLERAFDSFFETNLIIDGAKTQIWSWRGSEYISRALFALTYKGRPKSLEMNIASKNNDTRILAENIFKSLRLPGK